MNIAVVLIFYVGAVLGTLSGLALAMPETAAIIFEEDALWENATVVFFAATVVVAAIVYNRHPSRWRFAAFIGTTALIALLDELSFGERLLGWQPSTLYGVRIDSLHDLFQSITLYLSNEVPHPLAVAFALIAAAIAVAVAAFAAIPRLRAFCRTIAEHPSAGYVAVSAILILIAQILDQEFAALNAAAIRASYIEEHLEFTASTVLFFAGMQALSTGSDRLRQAHTRRTR